ncbi:MAG: cupredoxin domain-containing protein [Firmicutes bacterium]|nr:cupredoxin domain-containing protein [Bacillota bacterium]
MKKLSLLLGLVLAGAVVLAGCGGKSGGDAGGNGGEVVDLGTIELKDYEFVPNNLDLKAGVTYKVTLKNTGTQVHDFTIEGTNISKVVQPGATETLEFKLDKPGTINVVCAQPGHKDLGMHFTTEVK